ncbi:hypothetical protein NKW43_03880 [Gluconobacter albidus]|uniref:hypothetical protein n=1 Tax=Gluconobacter albidus TaxID=318683 RepID=UPI000AECD330|nr:hypothetical protein [Gluconobacter albidus]MCP1272822.1 hypothetical protein [Gluconobacter albidus]
MGQTAVPTASSKTILPEKRLTITTNPVNRQFGKVRVFSGMGLFQSVTAGCSLAILGGY